VVVGHCQIGLHTETVLTEIVDHDDPVVPAKTVIKAHGMGAVQQGTLTIYNEVTIHESADVA
jgi:hypothetical protein